MARYTYVVNGPSTYNDFDFPAQEGDYAYGQGGYAYGPGGYTYGPEQHVKWYVVETKVERVRVPASGYTRFGVAPLKNELYKENTHKYVPNDRHEGYEPSYESDYENSSPPRYHEREDLMANFLNKLQIGARPPTKTSNLSSPNKYRPTNLKKYYPTSPKKYRPTSPNKDRSVSPNKYHPTSPNKYRTTSPSKYRPTSPNKYRPTSPIKYQPTSPNKYPATSPNNYRPTNPNKYRPTSPIKYYPTSPIKYHPTNPDKYSPTSPNKYHPTNPQKYQATSPIKHRPTSSTHSYPSKESHSTNAQTLPEPMKYRPTSPTQNHPSKENNMNRFLDMPDPNKYQPISSVNSFPLKEHQSIRTQSLSDFPNSNYHRQSVGPPTTRRPLMAPTNDINEALGFLIESSNYSTQADPKRGVQTIEHEMRYVRPAFGGVTNRTYLRSNTIDSEEAIRRYNGARVL